MGQGDIKQPYKPSYGKVRCDVSGLMFGSNMVRQCKEPSVLKRYSTGGVVNVSIWVCAKCKHAVRYQFHGGLGCELERR